MDIRTPIPTNGGSWSVKFVDLWKKQAELLKQKFSGTVEEIKMPPQDLTDMPTFYVQKDSIVEILRYLKEDPNFNYQFLSDITATDEEAVPRFYVIYHLFSHQSKSRIRIKTKVGEEEEIPTAVSVWKGANWAEREVFDMFGIKFKGHPDLRRILMDSRWEGYPLRKDYPLRGYQVFSEPEPVHHKLLE